MTPHVITYHETTRTRPSDIPEHCEWFHNTVEEFRCDKTSFALKKKPKLSSSKANFISWCVYNARRHASFYFVLLEYENAEWCLIIPHWKRGISAKRRLVYLLEVDVVTTRVSALSDAEKKRGRAANFCFVKNYGFVLMHDISLCRRQNQLDKLFCKLLYCLQASCMWGLLPIDNAEIRGFSLNKIMR